jgi:hypothetical protein
MPTNASPPSSATRASSRLLASESAYGMIEIPTSSVRAAIGRSRSSSASCIRGDGRRSGGTWARAAAEQVEAAAAFAYASGGRSGRFPTSWKTRMRSVCPRITPSSATRVDVRRLVGMIPHRPSDRHQRRRSPRRTTRATDSPSTPAARYQHAPGRIGNATEPHRIRSHSIPTTLLLNSLGKRKWHPHDSQPIS